MIWQAPLAWLGLAALAIPIAIHLLSRRMSTRLPFPTLRFVPTDVPVSVTRRRLSDVLLLLLRCAVLVAAVAALAQPYLVTAARGRSLGSNLARAIVVDSSLSMTGVTPEGPSGLDAARTRARAMHAEATTATTIETADLTSGVAAASAWLSRASGRREIVVISDFQRGAMTRTALTPVSAETSIVLVAIVVAPIAPPDLPPTILGAREVDARPEARGDETTATWTSRPAWGQTGVRPGSDRGQTGVRPQAPPEPSAGPALTVFYSSVDRPTMQAAITAAQSVGSRRGRPDQPVVVVFPDAAERAGLLTDAQPIDRPWMFDLLNRARQNPLLTGDSVSAMLTSARRIARNGVETLAIFPESRDGFRAAAILASLIQAMTPETGFAELEPAHESAETLRAWETRPAPAATPRSTAPPGDSDGRWFWVAALALLTLETIALQRRKRRAAPVQESYERVA